MTVIKAPKDVSKDNMYKFAIILFVVGVVLITAHYLFLQKQQVLTDENWLISVDVSYTARQPESIIRIQSPYESKNVRLVGRRIDYPGLSIMPVSRKGGTKRGIRLRTHKPGTYQVGVEFSLQFNQASHFRDINNVLSPVNRELFLSDNEWQQQGNEILNSQLNKFAINDIEKEKILEDIYKFVNKLSKYKLPGQRSIQNIVSTKSANNRERAELMVAMVRKAEFPARVVSGIELKDDPAASPVYWVEAYINERWISYYPGLGLKENSTANYIPLDKYAAGIVSVSSENEPLVADDYALNYEIVVEKMPVSIKGAENNVRQWYQVFVLDRLGSDIKEQLALLMLLPISALLCGLIRQVGGLHSYGVFTPTILALAITYADKATISLILVITLVLVYFGRPSFYRDMARTPRLSIIFTLVATGMVIGVSILDYFSLVTDGYIILLPIVIVTSLIDRFFSTIESHGNHTAFIRLIWTFILTLTAFPILHFSWLGKWLLRYPEAHLLTLSLLVLVSCYPFGKHKIPKWLGFMSEPKSKKSQEA